MALRRIQDGIEPLTPGVRLLSKLGSLVVHCEEAASAKGHAFDKMAIDSIVNDREVQDWLDGMRKMALLPVKR